MATGGKNKQCENNVKTNYPVLNVEKFIKILKNLP